jgi:hypothetical protein
MCPDYNIRSSYEQSYQTLLASGNGQAFDPINTPGTGHDSSSFKSVHSQAPATSPSGFIGGGVDDRFDFQLVTSEFLDGEGPSYLSGSCHTFGNNGTHNLKGDISSGSSASPSVLAALETASDHLPVVADYQLPASVDVLLGTIPTTVGLGEIVDIGVTIENIANLITAIGADFLVWQQVGENEQDLAVWQQQFGTTTVIAVAVSEPSTIADIVIILMLVVAVHVTRQDVNRKWRRFKEQR